MGSICGDVWWVRDWYMSTYLIGWWKDGLSRGLGGYVAGTRPVLVMTGLRAGVVDGWVFGREWGWELGGGGEGGRDRCHSAPRAAEWA